MNSTEYTLPSLSPINLADIGGNQISHKTAGTKEDGMKISSMLVTGAYCLKKGEKTFSPFFIFQ
ncbi:MAG: hypothetical protein ACJAU0_000592 [Flavobacteriales bacterium]|jgi:hypothetical protein